MRCVWLPNGFINMYPESQDYLWLNLFFYRRSHLECNIINFYSYIVHGPMPQFRKTITNDFRGLTFRQCARDIFTKESISRFMKSVKWYYRLTKKLQYNWLSSAKKWGWQFLERPEVYKIKSRGKTIDPCGVPLMSIISSEYWPFTNTFCVLPVGKMWLK